MLGNILFLSIGALAICWALWQVVVRRIGADAAGIWSFFAPVATVLGGIFILHEEISYIGIMGGTMIICGVISAQTGLVKIAMAVAKRF